MDASLRSLDHNDVCAHSFRSTEKLSKLKYPSWFLLTQVVRLPESGVAEFEVKLNAKGSLPLGRKEIELPLESTFRFIR
jgi:hypothetical protein